MPIAQQQPDIAPKTLSRMETVSDNLQTSSYASNLVLTRAAYRLRLAESREDLESAFRLRYLVFNLELNEGLESANETGQDTDEFDKTCDHLIVEHRPSRQVVGTYRLQTGRVAGSNLGYYSEREFDFSPYEPIRNSLVELGRASIQRDHRSFEVLTLLRRGIAVYATERKARFLIGCSSLTSQTRHEWHRGCFLPLAKYRGLDDHEDHLLAAVFSTELALNQSVTLVFTTNADEQLDGSRAWAEHAAHENKLFAKWASHDAQAASSAPDWAKQLILAVDQFIVKRSLPEEADGRSIIAGYHWFGDWGRGTRIALPGFTLTTGRVDIAKKVLLAFSRYVDRGMLPNDFPDASGQPECNTVDAALWYFEAVRQYFAVTQDKATLVKLFPVPKEMTKAHLKGTRYQIHVDELDGLLYAGEPGVQLTWVDANVGDWVVTPRIGKPVEINTLWYNALETMAALAPEAGRPGEPFAKMRRW